MRPFFVACCLAVCLGAQTVQESFSRDPGPLDFIRGEGYEQAILQALTGDALVGLDDRCRVVPRLAESWTARPGTLRFKLRSDARFPDGSRLGAEDVLWTFGEIQLRPEASPSKKPILEGIRMRVENGLLVLDSPKPPARLLMELARISVTRKGCPDQGSGPYRMERRNGEWTFTAREHFLKPNIRQFRFRLLQDDQAILQNLQKGWLSIGVPPPRQGLRPPGTHVELQQASNAQLVVWSRSGSAPLRCLERWRGEAFPATLLGAKASPSRGLWPESLGFPPMAIRGNGTVPAGQRWELLYTSGDELAQKALLALRERARRDGVDLELRPVEAALLYERLQQGRFQLACALVLFDPHPWAVLDYLEPKGSMNFTGWKHPGLGRLLPKLQRPGDAAWAELQKLWSEDPAALPLLDFRSVAWVDRRLRVKPSVLGLYMSTPGPAGWSWAP